MNYSQQQDLLNTMLPELRKVVMNEFSNKLYVTRFMSPVSQYLLHVCTVELSGRDGGFMDRVVIDCHEIDRNRDKVSQIVSARAETVGEGIIEGIMRECDFARNIRRRWWFRLHTTLEWWWSRLRRKQGLFN